MSVWTLVSRLTGFVRVWAMAVALGVTMNATSIPIASSFNIANNIPNMIYELVAGGVLSAMFIPIFMEKLQRDGESDAWKFANTMFGITGLALGVVALVGTFLPDPFVITQTFRSAPAERVLAIYLFRFFAVQVIFYGWTALTTGVLNSYRHFVAPAAAPVLNNVVVTAVLLGAYVPLRDTRPDLAVIALGVGTTLGVVALFAAQVPAMLKLGFRFKLAMDFRDPAVRKMGVKMVPILGYVAVNIVGVSFRNSFATQAFKDGSATLSYAWSWYQLPYGVLAVSLITALFPELSSLADRADWSGYKTTLMKGLRAMSVLIMPAAALLVALAGSFTMLYRFGSFPADAVPLVGAVLSAWSLGLFSFATYMLVLRGFYAMQDSRTPMFTNILATAVQVGLYAVLTTQVWSGPYALVGIPLADAAAYTLHLALLLFLLRRRIGAFDAKSMLATWSKALVASAAGGAVAWAVRTYVPLGTGRVGALLTLILGGVLGLGIAFGLLVLLKVPEVRYATDVVRRATRRFLPEPRTEEP